MSDTCFVWDPEKYSVKVEEMDNQHQNMISMMNDLYQKNQAGLAKEEILVVLNDLEKYIIQHFREEEAFFLKLDNYDKKASHIKIHQDLLQKYSAHRTKYEESGTNTIAPDFFEFLRIWLATHISVIDMKYGQAASERVNKLASEEMKSA